MLLLLCICCRFIGRRGRAALKIRSEYSRVLGGPRANACACSCVGRRASYLPEHVLASHRTWGLSVSLMMVIVLLRTESLDALMSRGLLVVLSQTLALGEVSRLRIPLSCGLA